MVGHPHRLSAGCAPSSRSGPPRYAAADPFPHTVVDGVLTPEAFDGGRGRVPGRSTTRSGAATSTSTRRSTATPRPTRGGRRSAAVAKEFCGPEFVAYLEQLTGIEGLIPDWSMDGGGLHQTLRGRPPQHPRRLLDPSRPRELGPAGQHPALPQRGVAAGVGRAARAVGPRDDRLRGRRSPRPATGCSSSPRRSTASTATPTPDLPRGPGPPVAGPVLLHRGGRAGPPLHQLPGPARATAPSGWPSGPTATRSTSTTGSSAGSASPTPRCRRCWRAPTGGGAGLTLRRGSTGRASSVRDAVAPTRVAGRPAVAQQRRSAGQRTLDLARRQRPLRGDEHRRRRAP